LLAEGVPVVAILRAVKKWLERFAPMPRRKAPNAQQNSSATACPTCRREMVQIEKFTMTGDDLRTYRCETCGQEQIVNLGPALWKVLHDAHASEDDRLKR
jgi:transposase-like protein